MKLPFKPSLFWVRELFLATLAFFLLGFLFFNTGPVLLAGIFLGLALFSAIVFIWSFFKFITSKEASQKLFSFMKRMFSGITHGIKRVTNKVGRRLGLIADKILPKSILRLTHYKDEKTSLFRSQKSQRKSPYRRMKWKDLPNDTERVRFAYYFFMRKKIKKGFPYKPEQTPTEICQDIWQKEGSFNEVELFDMYNTYRYNKIDTNSHAEKLKTFI